MKARIIRGLSLPPTRVGKLVPKQIDEDRLGMAALKCPVCRKDIYRIPSTKVELCPNCNNVGVEFSRKDLELGYSVVAIENFALSQSARTSNGFVLKWCQEKIKHIGFRAFLNLDADSVIPRLNLVRVSTRIYFEILRFTMLNIVATHRRHLRFLDNNHVNIEGVKFLAPAKSYIKMFGANNDPHNGNIGRFSEGLIGGMPMGSLTPRELSAIGSVLEIYGVRIEPRIFDPDDDEDL